MPWHHQDRLLFQIAFLMLIAAIIIAPSLLIPFYLGKGAQSFDANLTAPDGADAVAALNDGFREELAGNLDDALTKYREAMQAKAETIQKTAASGADRVQGKLARLGMFYSDLKELNNLSQHARSPLLSITLLLFAISLLSRLWPRKGIALRPFPVAPQVEIETAAGFNRLLSQEINRIIRAFGSDQFGRIGVKIAMPDLVADHDQDDLWTRALSSLREDGLKTASRFSIGEMLRFLKNLGDRPVYVLSGSVLLTPDRALAQAQLTQVKDGKAIAVWEADSQELEILAVADGKESAPAGEATAHQVTVYTNIGGDSRQNAKLLADLAVVLACKIWHRLAQGAYAEMRPSSWQTIFLLVRALNALEQEK